MDYALENITAGEDNLFSEQIRSWTAEGEPADKNGPNEPGGYCQEWGRNSQRVLWWAKFRLKKGIKKIVCWNSFLMRKVLMKNNCDETH